MVFLLVGCGVSHPADDSGFDADANPPDAGLDADGSADVSASDTDAARDADAFDTTPPLITTCEGLYAYEARCMEEFSSCTEIEPRVISHGCDDELTALFACFVEERCIPFACESVRFPLLDCLDAYCRRMPTPPECPDT